MPSEGPSRLASIASSLPAKLAVRWREGSEEGLMVRVCISSPLIDLDGENTVADEPAPRLRINWEVAEPLDHGRGAGSR
jgi:hypothetical protein